MLTPRQAEVVRMVADGKRPKAIAAEIGVSRRTVEAHIYQAAQRIGGDRPVRDRFLLFVLRLDDC